MAVVVTVLVPAAKTEPDGGEAVTLAPGVAKEFAKFTIAELWSRAAMATTLDGHWRNKQAIGGFIGLNSTAPKSTAAELFVPPARILALPSKSFDGTRGAPLVPASIQ